MKNLLSIIYVYYNTPKEIEGSIKSIRKAVKSIKYEIIIVNNQSPKNLPKSIIKNQNVKIIKNKKNYGFGKAINQGAKISSGEYLLIINPDTEFLQNSIVNLFKEIQKNSKIGIIGPQVLNDNAQVLQSADKMLFLPQAIFIFSFLNRIWPFNKFYNEYHYLSFDKNIKREVEVVSGVCFLVKKEIFKKIKGFDEGFFMYFEESDLCFRIRKLGYKVLYFPKAKIIHLIGKSTKDKEWIKKTFEESRYKYFIKYHGQLSALLAEIFLRTLSLNNLLVLLIILVSLFLNLNKISELMMFQGDFGRDYLAAKDMLLTGKIPLVGIPSSVVWLHQGPLSIYLIGLAFFMGQFNPVAPAVLYGMIGSLSTLFVYKLGKKIFNNNIGLLASIFFATSPLIVVNARMPYHTASIPFFTTIFFIILYKVLKGSTNLLGLLFFVFGLMFQLELSNGVVLLVLALLWFIYKPAIKKYDLLKSLFGLIIGIIPFLLYDISHHFTQTFGFLLWVINRTRLFFGLTISGNSTTAHLPAAVTTIKQQILMMIFPENVLITYLIIIIGLFFIWKNKESLMKKDLAFVLLLSWLAIVIVGFLIHAAPGPAYFPLIFPVISILVGFTFYNLIQRTRYALFIFLALIFINSNSTINNNYYLTTNYSASTLLDYNFGYSLNLRDDITKFIVKDAKGKKVEILAGGFISKYQTGVDNYKYLVWYNRGKINNDSNLKYIIYEEKKEIPKNQKIVYDNNYIYVIKNEKK